MRGRMASKALAKKNYESRVRSSPKGMQGNSRQGAAQWQTKHQYYSTFLQIHIQSCFIYVLDSSNSSSFTF